MRQKTIIFFIYKGYTCIVQGQDISMEKFIYFFKWSWAVNYVLFCFYIFPSHFSSFYVYCLVQRYEWGCIRNFSNSAFFFNIEILQTVISKQRGWEWAKHNTSIKVRHCPENTFKNLEKWLKLPKDSLIIWLLLCPIKWSISACQKCYSLRAVEYGWCLPKR